MLALVVMLAVGAVASLYVWNVHRRRDEAAAGIRALSAMRWREFSQFVLDAMRHRGYDVLTPGDEAERGQQTEFLLSKDGKRSLLSCKHGSAYHLAAPAVAELAASVNFQGASSGLLVTPGQIDAAARAPAREAQIELIDGVKLWPEVAPLLPPSLTEEVSANAKARAKRLIAFAWFGSLALGAVVAMLGAGSGDSAPPAPPVARAPVVATPTPAAPVAQAPMPTPAPAPTTEEERVALEDMQRLEVVRTVSSLPGIDRALWSTRSTLLVHLAGDGSDRLNEICAILERYEGLRTARVQLQPPQGSTERVRFRQCRTI